MQLRRKHAEFLVDHPAVQVARHRWGDASLAGAVAVEMAPPEGQDASTADFGAGRGLSAAVLAS